MGTSCGQGAPEASNIMRAVAILIVAIAAVKAEADADAYTIGQVALGLTHGGIVTGVSHGYGLGYGGLYGGYGGYGVYGKREADSEPEAYTIGQVALGLTHGGIVTGVSHGYGLGYGGLYGGYGV